MSETTSVKCIRIDSLNRRVYLDQVEVPVLREYHNSPAPFQKGMFLAGYDHKAKFHTVCYYKDIVESPKDLPRHGLLLRNIEFDDNLDEAFDRDRHTYKAIAGNALIVSYKVQGKKQDRKHIAIDTKFSVEQIQKLVGEWTLGVEFRLPDFECILQESFSDPGYELLLRVDNEVELYEKYSEELTKPIRHLNQQIITFTYQWDHEITIVSGKIKNPDDNVQVSILQSGRADLRAIAACTLKASKAPTWIRERLRNYFFESLVANKFERTSAWQKRFNNPNANETSPPPSA